MSILAIRQREYSRQHSCDKHLDNASPVDTVTCVGQHAINKATEAVDDEYRLVSRSLSNPSREFFKHAHSLLQYFETIMGLYNVVLIDQCYPTN